jgi:hypothetical protein
MQPVFRVLAILTMALCLLTSACSSSKSSKLTPMERRLLSRDIEINVFAARGFLGGSDYERYHFADDVMWRECGGLSSPTKKDETKSSIDGDDFLLPDPNLEIEERRVEYLTDKQAVHLRKLAKAFSQAIGKSKKKLPLPGSVYSLAKPGLFEIEVSYNGQKSRLLTSVDAVSSASKSPLTHAQTLFETLRGLGPVFCEAKTFYGIDRLQIR